MRKGSSNSGTGGITWTKVHEIIRSSVDHESVMIVLTIVFAIIGGLTEETMWTTVALLPAFPWGQLDNEAGPLCERCGETLEDESQKIYNR